VPLLFNEDVLYGLTSLHEKFAHQLALFRRLGGGWQEHNYVTIQFRDVTCRMIQLDQGQSIALCFRNSCLETATNSHISNDSNAVMLRLSRVFQWVVIPVRVLPLTTLARMLKSIEEDI
jgi:hypothetical protein